MNNEKIPSMDEFILSIAQYDEKDQTKEVNSPRSVLACKQEGIDPKELIYKPLEYYTRDNISSAVSRLRYEGFEKRRKDLIQIVTKRREEIIKSNMKKQEKNLDKIISMHNLRSETSISTKGPVKLSYEQLIEKGKKRESLLLKKMLCNESKKNDKYEEEMRLRELENKKEMDEQKRLQKNLKKEAEMKLAKDLEKREQEKTTELLERKLASENIQKLIKAKEQDDQVKKEKEKKRINLKKQKEEERKIKSIKSQELQVRIQEKMEEKAALLQKRSKEIEEQLLKHKQVIG